MGVKFLKKFKFLSALLILLFPVVCSADDSNLNAECSNGIFKGLLSDDVIIWRGVPYAKPPVGNLRWKAPEAPDDSTENFEAYNFSKMPIQHKYSSNPASMMEQGEDCLYLNVWKASTDITSEKRPVLVWIHGGAFTSGGTGSPYYDGERFVKGNQNIIYVSVGYRLGIMGLIDFANSEIEGGDNFKDAGNLSLLDIIQSLKWLKNNISAFGGDPDNITLMGQSSGASSISLIIASGKANDLFNRAIIESGAVTMTGSIEECKVLAQKLSQLTSADTMQKLMNLSEEDLKDAAEKLQAYTNFPERDGIFLNKNFVTEDTDNLIADFATNMQNFDILTGSNADELTYWALALDGLEDFSKFVAVGYNQIASGIANYASQNVNLSPDAKIPEQFINLVSDDFTASADVWSKVEFLNYLFFTMPVHAQASQQLLKNSYVYFWEYPSATMPYLGACHSCEMPFFLNIATDYLQQPFNEDFAAKVQSLIKNFVTSGDPSTGEITWPSISNVENYHDKIIFFRENGTIETSAEDGVKILERFNLISDLLKYGLSGRDLINAVDASSEEDDPDNPDPNNSTPNNPDDDKKQELFYGNNKLEIPSYIKVTSDDSGNITLSGLQTSGTTTFKIAPTFTAAADIHWTLKGASWGNFDNDSKDITADKNTDNGAATIKITNSEISDSSLRATALSDPFTISGTDGTNTTDELTFTINIANDDDEKNISAEGPGSSSGGCEIISGNLIILLAGLIFKKYRI